MPNSGETIHSTAFEIGYGGKGCNQVVTATRLGCKTALIAKVGNDPYGINYREHLTKEGINTQLTSSCESYTGVALIVVNSVDGNNQIVINSNANQNLSKEDVARGSEIMKNSQVCNFINPRAHN